MFSAVARSGFLAAILALPVCAGNVLDSEGFRHFYNLEYDEAIAAFSREIEQSPKEPDPYNHLAQSVLFRDMLRAGALESELVTGNNPFLRRPKVNASREDQKMFDGNIRKAMSLSKTLLEKNPRDTHALYTMGVAYGLRANYNFLVRKAWRDALRDATTARKYHDKVTRIDPSLIDARLMQGAHDYLVGSLPFGWRLLGFLVGFHANKAEGIRTLEMVAKRGNLNRIDAEVLLCAIYRREKKPQLAMPLLEDLIRRFPRNYLLYFELAQMQSDLGNKAKALAPLQRLEVLRRDGAPGYRSLPPEKIWYAEANIQFWYNDLDHALENMRKATARAGDLDLNTGVLAWMRLGQIYDLKGQRARALDAYRRAIELAPESDAARESRGYLAQPYHRRSS